MAEACEGAASSTLRTERFRLRLLTADITGHADLYRRLYTCPQVMAQIGPPMAPDVADAAFVRACRHNRLDAPGHRFWAIEPRGSGSPIGLAALRREHDQAEIGIMLVPRWQNAGVASESFSILLPHAFRSMALALIYAQRSDDGHARIIDRLLGRFGFVRTSAAMLPPDQCRWVLPRRCVAETEPRHPI
jgi:RimJ/RimL family protein N-acetyltransferase